MSWQSYVDTNLVGTKNVTKGAIIGLNGSTWAISAGLQVRKFFNILSYFESALWFCVIVNFTTSS